MQNKETCVLISDWELGAGKQGTSKGPEAVIRFTHKRESDFFERHTVQYIRQTQLFDLDEHAMPFLKNGPQLYEHQKRLCQSTYDCIEADRKVLLLSGDHSNAIGGLSGLCKAKKGKNVGVIWIDAHMELHSPYSTPSGNVHGMSMNAIVGDDNIEFASNAIDEESANTWQLIKQLKHQDGEKNRVKPEHIVYIGVRDFERQEEALIQKHGIRCYYPEDLAERGMANILEETLAYLHDCDYLYVSYDVDSMDPGISIGTGTPVENGLSLEQGQLALKTLWNCPKTQVLEITEVNPTLEMDNEMAKAVAWLIDRSFAG
ncbi:MAG: arginase [Bacteroidia bacterium]